MKNILTVTALLVAGMAFANAEGSTLPEPSWTELTLTAPSGTLSAGNSGFIWSDYSNNSLTESWQLSFDWTSTNDADTIDLFGMNGASNQGAKGIVLQWKSDNGGTLQFGTKDGNSFASLTNIAMPSTSKTVVLTYLKSSDSSTPSVLKLKLDGNEGTVAAPDSDTTFLGSNGKTRLWTNSGKDTYSNISLKYGAAVSPAVPEPSAFGLLAGAGALALVAARRRRRAK